MAVHWDPRDGIRWKKEMSKAGKRIMSDEYPPGGRLPVKPVTSRGRRRHK